MNEIIMQQILAIRETGETNMFDLPVVTSIAFKNRLYGASRLP